MKFLSLVLVFGALLAAVDRVESKKTCQNLFNCMTILFRLPFRDMMKLTYLQTNSIMAISQETDEQWDGQMGLMTSLCDIWVEFNTCMDPNWIDCIDWDQLSSMVQLVGGAGDVATGQASNTAQNAATRQQQLDQAKKRMDNSGWSKDDTKNAMKIATEVCNNVHQFVPYLSCFRDLILSNETMINMTLWNMGLSKTKNCSQNGDLNCGKLEKLMKMWGNWLYYGCGQGTEVLTNIVRTIFEGMMFTSDEACADIFRGKSAADLFAQPYDKQTEIDFGNDISKCNLTAVAKFRDDHYVSDVMTYIRSLNLTKEEFYHKQACRMKNISLNSCDIWPIPTTKSIITTTTAATTRTTTMTASTKTAAAGVPARQVAGATTKKNGKSKTTTEFEDYDDGAGSVSLDSRLLPLIISLAVFFRLL